LNLLWEIVKITPDDLQKMTLCERMAQLSFVGRAVGPPVQPSTLDTALHEHQSLLTSGGSPTPEFLTELFEFCKEWAKRHRGKNPGIHEVAASGGASIGFPRKVGGHSAKLCEAFQTAPEGYSVYPDYCLQHEWDTIAGDARVRDVLREEVKEIKVPKGIAVPLAEPGCKTRVISKGEPSLVPLAHSIRHLLFSILRTDPVISKTFGGDQVGAVKSITGRLPPGFLRVISTDMTVATDGIYMSVFQQAFAGIADGLGLSDEARRIGNLCCGPQEMTWRYSDGRTETCETNRGAMMGLPTTFALLCVIHKFCAERAIQSKVLDRTGKKPMTGFLHRRYPYSIWGDDAIALWPKDLEQMYRDNLSSIGAAISPNKHFVTPVLRADGKPRIGWFCEKMYTFYSDGANSTVVAGDALPLRGLTHLGSAIPREGGVVDRGYPGWASVGATVTSLVELRPDHHDAIAWGIRASHPGLARWFFQRGLLPYLPRELGGAGLVAPGKLMLRDVAPQAVRKALAVLLTDESADADWLAFERSWVSAHPGRHRGLASYDVEDILAEGGYKFYRGTVPEGLEDLAMSRQSFERRLTHFRAKSYLFMLGPDPENGWRIKPTTISKSNQRTFKKLISQWASAHPIKDMATSEVLAIRRKFLDSVQVSQRLVDAGGNFVDAPFPCTEDDAERIVMEEWRERGWVEQTSSWNDLVLIAEEVKALISKLPPKRFTILGGERSLGSVFRQKSVADDSGWTVFLYGPHKEARIGV
jgi:hypothetical protein